MDTVYWDKLRQRQKEIDKTLRHLGRERREVEENTEWINRAAYKTRIDLLDHLTTWYQEETSQIEKALKRIDPSLYSLCIGCHEPIEPERLDTEREAEFCLECDA